MGKIFGFHEQLKVGQEGELFLDTVFSKNFKITEIKELQALGIDRIFENKKTRFRTSVEYKTCKRAQETGNLFVETVSNTTSEKLGWGYTCTAQVLIWFIPGLRTICMLDTLKLRNCLPNWIKLYETKTCRNPNYNGLGVLIPVPALIQECNWIKKYSKDYEKSIYEKILKDSENS